jgi:hypothetical protein
MGFVKPQESNLYHREKGEGLPIPPAAFRETARRRWRPPAASRREAWAAGQKGSSPVPSRSPPQ